MSTAFDTAASTYDRSFTRRTLGRLFRETVQAELDVHLHPGDHVLELGCGTGEDALHLARRGVRVSATDASEAMLEAAAGKARGAGMAARVRFHLLDLADPEAISALPGPRVSGSGAFDGAFSNFGVLNCIRDRRGPAEALASRLRRGAPLVLVLMGPLCPWEVAWHVLALRPKTAFRRLGNDVRAPVGDPPRLVRVWYPSAGRVMKELAPWFRHRRTVGVGVVLPPPYLQRVVEGRPKLTAALARWDRRVGRRLPGRWLNDHYILAMERR